MNELLPDPTGDDSGHEWVELHNLTDQTVLLNGCVLNISGTQYPFAPDDMLEPKEFRIFLQISDGSNLRTLSLKNSGQSIISFGHKVNNSFQPIQTVQYQDALENQSWARFEAGWRWTAPDATNDGTLLPTEFPAPDSTAPAAPLVGTGDPTSAPATQANVQITELLPNPAAPATDDQDEFVELYNSGETAVNLKDYQVQTGSNYTHSYTFDTSSLGSHEYMTLTSGKTTLSLANGGGRARLQKPDGTTINGIDPYTDAPEGASWALIDGTWRWTTTPTSGTANVMTAAVPPVAQAATSNTKLSTKSPRSSISTAKPKATTTSSKLPKAKTISTPKTKAASTAAGAARNGNDATSPSNLHPIIIAGVGSLAVGYAIYEYRHDLANRIYQLRRYRAARRAARTAYAGR